MMEGDKEAEMREGISGSNGGGGRLGSERQQCFASIDQECTISQVCAYGLWVEVYDNPNVLQDSLYSE